MSQRNVKERHRVIEDGKRRSRTTDQLLLLVLQRKALGGDLAAKRYLDELRDRFSPADANSQGHGCLLIPEAPKGSLEEQMAMLGVPIEPVEDLDAQ